MPGGQDAGMSAPTECNGMPLGPRARVHTMAAIGPEAAGLTAYWPTTAWKSADPATLGLDATKLQAAVDFSTAYSSNQAVFVVRHGYVAAEKYFGGFSATMQHESYSMAKSFTGVLVGIAIDQGLLSGVDEKICKYYPSNWNCNDSSDPRSRITVEHAMNIETGLQWSEDWRSNATGVNDAFNFDLLTTVLSRPAVDEPGTKKRYSTGDPALLTGVIQGVTGKTAFAFAQQVLLNPIGATGVTWNSDSSGRTTTYAGVQATAADYARFGYLLLNHGQWDGKQLVSAKWVDFTTQAVDPCTEWYRFLYHINPPVRLGPQDPSCPSLFCQPTSYADLPGNTYFAAGINGQLIFIMPSVDMVIVRLASDQSGSEHWDEYAREFLTHILDAVK